MNAAIPTPAPAPVVEAWSEPAAQPAAQATPATGQRAAAPGFNPKILVGAALAAVVVAACAWIFFKPSGTQDVMAPERLHTPSGAVAEEDLARAASIVGPQSETSSAVAGDSAAAQMPAEPQALPQAEHAPALDAPSVVTPAPQPAAAPAPKPAAAKPAPKPANTLDGLLD